MLQLAADDTAKIDSYQNLVVEAPRSGFETAIHLPANLSRRYIGAAAIAANGDVLGSTHVIDMENGLPVTIASNISSIRAPVKTPVKADLGATGFQVGAAILALAGAVYLIHYGWRRWIRQNDDTTLYTEIGGTMLRAWTTAKGRETGLLGSAEADGKEQ